MKIEVTDVSGAGDTVSAIFILMQICDISLENSLRVSNLGGSMVCQISGAVPINSNELISISIERGWL
jgi:bifunctional ADP-heptose synthase (sugar kinase/adenylyltransferase)